MLIPGKYGTMQAHASTHAHTHTHNWTACIGYYYSTNWSAGNLPVQWAIENKIVVWYGNQKYVVVFF